MIDEGKGPPIVLIPGIQGRWEWMQPAVRALARRCRVLSFSLVGEPGTGRPERARTTFDDLLEQVDEALDAAGLSRAVVCGVSFGGLIALKYAARRPARVTALILVSAPGPRWQPDEGIRETIRAPRLRLPRFLAGAVRRVWLELGGTYATFGERMRFAVRFLWIVLRAPASATRMAQRARMALEDGFAEDCRRVNVPTLVVTGEPALDRVVPAEETLQYVRSIRGARSAILKRTGHLGLATRPAEFAATVASFAMEHAGDADRPASAREAMRESNPEQLPRG
jgi:3-oxoadipate enol-lactonase